VGGAALYDSTRMPYHDNHGESFAKRAAAIGDIATC
jgi:hypothetical protein